MTDLRSQQMGDVARRLLRPGTRGRVLAGFSRAAYLETEEAALTWLADQTAPMHARAVSIAGPLPRLAVGMAFMVIGSRIVIGTAAYAWISPRPLHGALLRSGPR